MQPAVNNANTAPHASASRPAPTVRRLGFVTGPAEMMTNATGVPLSARQAGAYVGKSPRCVRPRQAIRPFVTESVNEATLRGLNYRVALCFFALGQAREGL